MSKPYETDNRNCKAEVSGLDTENYQTDPKSSPEFKILKKILTGSDSNVKKDNGNVDGETAMGTALHVFANLSKTVFIKDDEFIPTEIAKEIYNGGIYVHDLEFFNLTATCCQIDMFTLLRRGFHSGKGWIRGCKRFGSACTNLCVIIQGNQNEMHGGQSVSSLDYELGRFVDIEFLYQILKIYDTRPEHRQPKERIVLLKKLRDDLLANEDRVYFYFAHNNDPANEYDYEYPEPVKTVKSWFDEDEWYQIIKRVVDSVYQGLEAIVYNLSSMHSRAGAQIPFSSVNFGTCMSWEGRLVSKALLQAQWNGLGNGESPIFPITIFKVKDGINYNPTDRNYDLLLEAVKVSAKRLFPNFVFQDSSINKLFWKQNNPLREVAVMGCRSRVVTNVHDKNYEQIIGRGNVSFTTVNLPYAALECKQEQPEFVLSRDNVDSFFDNYIMPKMTLLRDLLIRRLRVVGARTCAGQPFLMGQDIWIDSGYVSTVEYIKCVYPTLKRLKPTKALSEKRIAELKKRYNTIIQRIDKYESANSMAEYKSEDEKYMITSPLYRHVGIDSLIKQYHKKHGVCPEICEVTNPVLEGWLFDLPPEIHNEIIEKVRRPHTLRDPQIQRLKHGSLSIGYIGLAECLTCLLGQHHGESEKANLLGRLLIQRMRQQCDVWAKAYKLNFTLLQTPAEGLSFNALLKTRDKFGIVKGVTDKQYITNSSHVPVGCKISAYDKIRVECTPMYDERTATLVPGYSTLANAGHICYVELDGNLELNLEAFMQILRFMHDNDVGYGAVNHPVDRDPVCGYTGVI